MALKTDYKDAMYDGSRKYRMTENNDGTVSFVDATSYTQEGDRFGAKDINDTNAAINRLNGVVTVSLLVSGWSAEYPHIQTVRHESIKEADEPSMMKSMNGTETSAEVDAYEKAYGLIFAGKTADGSATFYAKKIPETDITVGLKGVS